MKKNILIKQHDIKDCGAACIASVAAHYDLFIPIAKIRQLCHTDTRGTNILGVVEGLEKLGFVGKGVKGPVSALAQIPLPAIAHVIINQQLNHFVVIYNVSKTDITIMDPFYGELQKMSIDEFSKIWTGALVLLEPNEYFEQRNEKVSNYQRFWNLIQPHKSIIGQSLFGALIYTLLGLSASIYIQKITDNVLPNGNTRLLNILSVIMIVLLLFQIFINSFKSVLVLLTGQRIDRFLILGYYKHLLDLPQRFFDTMKIGEITSRINDAVKIRAFINDVAIQCIVNFFIVFFSFILMFSYHWKLALILFLVIPIYILVYWISNKLNKKVERDLMEHSADLESHLVESIGAVRTIKIFGLELYANNKTDLRFSTLLTTVYKSVLNSIFTSNSTEVLSRLFTIILLWTGSYFVISQEMTPGELLSYYALIGYFTSPIAQLIESNKAIQNALIASDRLFEIMDLEREDQTNKVDVHKDKIGDISFHNITFRYGSRADIFENFSCTFQKGKTTAIVGPSGSGKTTISSLILNLYPLVSGKITLGEIDMKYISSYALRDLIGVVPQNIDIFSGNFIENIAVGEEFPDMELIMKLCKDVGILSFIEGLPKGFQTYLGENGALLSGGQKQRVAIARALYKQPEIIIMDEATSSLDSEAEQYIQKALQKLQVQGKTVILIAHRLSTITYADKIMILQDGHVIEEGTHKNLIDKKGAYFNLWQKQTYQF